MKSILTIIIILTLTLPLIAQQNVIRANIGTEEVVTGGGSSSTFSQIQSSANETMAFGWGTFMSNSYVNGSNCVTELIDSSGNARNFTSSDITSGPQLLSSNINSLDAIEFNGENSGTPFSRSTNLSDWNFLFHAGSGYTFIFVVKVDQWSGSVPRRGLVGSWSGTGFPAGTSNNSSLQNGTSIMFQGTDFNSRIEAWIGSELGTGGGGTTARVAFGRKDNRQNGGNWMIVALNGDPDQGGDNSIIDLLQVTSSGVSGPDAINCCTGTATTSSSDMTNTIYIGASGYDEDEGVSPSTTGPVFNGRLAAMFIWEGQLTITEMKDVMELLNDEYQICTSGCGF